MKVTTVDVSSLCLLALPVIEAGIIEITIPISIFAVYFYYNNLSSFFVAGILILR